MNSEDIKAVPDQLIFDEFFRRAKCLQYPARKIVLFGNFSLSPRDIIFFFQALPAVAKVLKPPESPTISAVVIFPPVTC